jgi:hypothetical protein
MEKKKQSGIIITELFLIKADWNRTFMGEIIRETTADGKELVRGCVIINEGKAWSTGRSQSDLARNLDDICIMKLDYHLHSSAGITIKIAGEVFFLN